MSQTRTLASMPLTNGHDVVTARLNARRAAEMLGLDRQSQTRIATAVSEIARNAASYGRKGEVTFLLDPRDRQRRFTVLVTDQGPGIEDLDAVLSGEKTFPAGRGAGLASARRLVDEFDIQSSPSGTRVSLSQRIPRTVADRLSARALDRIEGALPNKPADPIAEVHEQNRELIESLNDVEEQQAESNRLSRELEETNRGVVALYSELELQAERLRDVSEMKSRFLSQMSHECRTPLNSILALSRLLQDEVDGSLNGEQKRQVDYIRRSAQTLLEMVNDLLDLAKVEAGKLAVAPSLFSVPTLFASLRGALRPLLGSPDVELLFEAGDDLPRLFADEQKVSQILRNFIANALKFTEQGHVRVSARHDARNNEMVFSVEDTGIGIDAKNLDEIFEEFSQVAGRLQKGGTGLGLPLSRKLAGLLGGRVLVQSKLGVGSTFELAIPVQLGEPAPRSAGKPGAKRILVIDDEDTFRYVIRHIAQDAGYDVLEAPDGESGMQVALDQRPDIIVLDLHMPRMDGFTALAKLAESNVRATPVIVCSALALSPEQKRSLASAYAIVPKHEVSRDGLRALLDTVLAERTGVA
jgi:signal transduction histidine kinase/CheY-like chemotaxis protein